MSSGVSVSVRALLSCLLIAVTALIVALLIAGRNGDELDTSTDLTPAPAIADLESSGDGDLIEPDSVALEPAETPASTPTPVPTATATPVPTPTAVPEPVAFLDVIERPDLGNRFTSPLPDCALAPGFSAPGFSAPGTKGLTCIGTESTVDVVPVAPGQIVGIVNEPAIALADDAPPAVRGEWSWSHQLALGPHVVVDHGPVGDSPNVQTVYAGLASIADDLSIGVLVDPTAPIGTVAGPQAKLAFSLWDANVRQDDAIVVSDGPEASTQQAVAQSLGELIGSPTDPQCPLSIAGGQLPGAPRGYRNGTHQGIDFNCGTSDRFGQAIADGRVVYLVDDYRDPTVANRELLLRNAGLAGFTPHWTLVMLYGNVVVIDHGDIAGAGRVYTIAAHLEAVDPEIELGAVVRKGQRLGELGNRGTNASAQGVRGAADPSLHLHWELFVDNWYLGSGLPADQVQQVIRETLCGAAATPGCPTG